MSYSKGWKTYVRYIPHDPIGSLVDSMWFIGPNLGLDHSFWVGKELDCNYALVSIHVDIHEGILYPHFEIIAKVSNKKCLQQMPPFVCDEPWPCSKAIVTQEGDGFPFIGMGLHLTFSQYLLPTRKTNLHWCPFCISSPSRSHRIWYGWGCRGTLNCSHSAVREMMLLVFLPLLIVLTFAADNTHVLLKMLFWSFLVFSMVCQYRLCLITWFLNASPRVFDYCSHFLLGFLHLLLVDWLSSLSYPLT